MCRGKNVQVKWQSVEQIVGQGCNTSYPSPKNESHQNTLPGRPTDQTKKVIGWGDFAVFVRIC